MEGGGARVTHPIIEVTPPNRAEWVYRSPEEWPNRGGHVNIPNVSTQQMKLLDEKKKQKIHEKIAGDRSL